MLELRRSGMDVSIFLLVIDPKYLFVCVMSPNIYFRNENWENIKIFISQSSI